MRLREAFSIAIALLVMPVAMWPVRAAECDPPPLAGVWLSTSPVTRQVVRAEIGYRCRKGDGSGTSRIEHDYTLRIWSKCAPRNCPWGAATVRRDEKGRLVAEFRQFYSRRIVSLESAGLGLLVRVRIDYYDGERPDEVYEQFLERR